MSNVAMIKNIRKRDGRLEPWNPAKVNGWGQWAAENDSIGSVDWQSVVMRAVGKLPEECSSVELQDALIRECLEQETWGHQRMAGRLYASTTYKEIYPGGKIPTVKSLHRKLQDIGYMVDLGYTDEEYRIIEGFIKHDRDFRYPHYQLFQLRNKYALRNRLEKKEYESPQFVFMRMAMALAQDQPTERKLHDVKSWYNHFSLGRISPPTPNYVNLGTKLNSYASCFPAGTMITTENGRKPIEQVVVGERVLTHNNRFKSVYATHVKPYNGKFVTFNTVATFKDEITSTEDHRFWVIKQKQSNSIENRESDETTSPVKREWVKADALRIGDYVKIPYIRDVENEPIWIWDLVKDVPYIAENFVLDGDNIRYVLKTAKVEGKRDRHPTILNANIRNADLFRLFGYFLAEGCVCEPKNRTDYCKHLIFTFATKDNDYIEDVCAILKSLGARVSVSANPADNSTKISCHSKVVTELFSVLFGHGFATKRLPLSIMVSEKNLQENLLIGLLRGDGCATISGYVLQLSNIELIVQIRDVALRCGLHLSMNKPDDDYFVRQERAPYAVLAVNVAGTPFGQAVGKNYHKCRQDRTSFGKNVMFLEDGAWGRIRGIDSFDKECDVYDLSVTDDTSFTAGGAAAHNCCLTLASDSEGSLSALDHIAYRMTAASAGLGAMVNSRSIGDPVRGGVIRHSGKLPYYASYGKSIRANMQNGRAGAGAMYFTVYDPEIQVLMKLKNPMSVEDRRNRDMDYGLIHNKFFARKVARNEEYFLFNCFTAPDLHEAIWNPDESVFEALYAKYEADPNFKKTYLNARDVIRTWIGESFTTGHAHMFMSDEVNRHTPFKDTIYTSNLCVAPESTILTRKGHERIETLVGQRVDVWNGHEWSNVEIVKTGVDQELWTVELDSFRWVTCTPYHRWLVEEGTESTSNVVIKRTHELEPGMKLVRTHTPVIEGIEDMEHAYMNGFYTADGTDLGRYGKLYLYGKKKELKEHFPNFLTWKQHKTVDRLEANTNQLYPKFTVPGVYHTVKSRLEWLAGYLDGDGTVHRNGENDVICATSTNLRFLHAIQDMLQTLGCNSKIAKTADEGWRKMPANDGSSELKDFYCKTAYRMVIAGKYVNRLLDLGLKTNRLVFRRTKTERDCTRHVKVRAVVNEGRRDDTYCAHEPLRNTIVINGQLTHNCVEVYLPTRGYETTADLYQNGPVAKTKIAFRTPDGLRTNTFITGAPLKRCRLVDITRILEEETIDVTDLKPGDRYAVGSDDGNYYGSYEFDHVISVKHEPEVALCNLAALIPTNINNEEEYASAAYYALLMIDKTIHLSTYVLPHVGYTAKQRMSAGVGLMDIAHLFARKRLRFDSPEGLAETHRIAERHMYHLIRASLRLGKELGNAPWIHKTKWVDGWLPIDTYNRNVDRICSEPLHYDWESLRQEIIENGGIRNSVVGAIMPGESSSKAMGCANAVYPVRKTSMKKSDNELSSYWVAPFAEKYRDYYQSAWDIPMEDYVNYYAVYQKFLDQGGSWDLFRRIEHGDYVGSDEVLKVFLRMHSLGLKGRYYQNSHTSAPLNFHHISDDIEVAMEEIVECIRERYSVEPNTTLLSMYADIVMQEDSSRIWDADSVVDVIMGRIDVQDLVTESAGCAGGGCKL